MSQTEFGIPLSEVSVLQALDEWELERGRHLSPFEQFKSRYPHTRFEDMHTVMKFDGSLIQLVDELGVALQEPTTGINFINIALHPPRIIRAAVDYKVSNPLAEDGEELVRRALRIGLSVYRREPVAIDVLRNFRMTLITEGDAELLMQQVVQTDDPATWHATDPAKSFETARSLRYRVENPDIFFIALGHGGIAAGMDVFLYYCGIAQSRNSQFYPVRFSRMKNKDLSPRLSDRELDFFRETAEGRQVVVFDEDTVSGDTLEIATDTIADILAPIAHPIIAVRNVKIGGKSEKNTAGLTLINEAHINLNPIPETKYKNKS